MTQSTVVLLSTTREQLPASIQHWIDASALQVLEAPDDGAALAFCQRGHPRLLISDARADSEIALRACTRLKADAFTAVVPIVMLVSRDPDALSTGFHSGADEVLTDGMSALEIVGRLDMAVRRSDRDVRVHPSTRLPGTVTIEAEISRRMALPVPFAVCYADLDHFKEYNDRYGYHDGDRVIQMLSRILHDVVVGMCGTEGFVGHIGGDDFIFIIPAAGVDSVCEEIVNLFDLLVPYQYSEADRRAGYYFGKDRRGQLHRVPLMTVSIGVVTNIRRHFTSPSHVSELATEMKGYAKSLPGSVYAIDRRQEHVKANEPAREPEEPSLRVSDDR